MPNGNLIGSLGACIDGDMRYYDSLSVHHDPVTGAVTVSVRSSGAVGGMDGPGGSYDAGVQWSRTTGTRPTAKDVMALVREAIGHSHFCFKRYGKPTQRFSWVVGDRDKRAKGLNLALVVSALHQSERSAAR